MDKKKHSKLLSCSSPCFACSYNGSTGVRNIKPNDNLMTLVEICGVWVGGWIGVDGGGVGWFLCRVVWNGGGVGRVFMVGSRMVRYLLLNVVVSSLRSAKPKYVLYD